MKKRWFISDAKDSSHGTMICDVCNNKILPGDGLYLTSEKIMTEEFQSYHRKCTENNRNFSSHWVKYLQQPKLNTITEQQLLKDKCTPELIKWMVELAEGFVITEPTLKNPAQEFGIIYFNNCVWDFVDINDFDLFPLLIHRAVEGWNKKHIGNNVIIISDDFLTYYGKEAENYSFSYYQLKLLTQAECAILHCLLDIFKEERG